MKKSNSKAFFAKIVLVTLLMCLLSACSNKLNGTYTYDDGVLKQSFTFDKEGTVEASAFGINIEGEYVIEDEKIIITYKLLGLSYDWEASFSKKGSSIFIDVLEFVKQ